MAKTKQVETQYVRLDGHKFTVAQTRGQFYGAPCKRPTVSDSEWAEMVRSTISIERKILKAMNIVLTPDITVKLK
jgi:hypothetical protein